MNPVSRFAPAVACLVGLLVAADASAFHCGLCRYPAPFVAPAQFAAGDCGLATPAPAPAVQYQTVTEYVQETQYRPVSRTVYQPQTYTAQRPVYDTVTEQVPYTTTRPVYETHEQLQSYTVNKPVVETHMQEQRYTVNRPVVREVMEQVPYTTTRPVYETNYREVTRRS